LAIGASGGGVGVEGDVGVCLEQPTASRIVTAVHTPAISDTFFALFILLTVYELKSGRGDRRTR
jgi:hypothetical protein